MSAQPGPQSNNQVLLISVVLAAAVGSALCWWLPGGHPPVSLAHAVLGVLGIGVGWLLAQVLLDAVIGSWWLPGGPLATRPGLLLLDLRHVACFALGFALMWRAGWLALAAGVAAWLSYRLTLRVLAHRLAWTPPAGEQ